MTLLDEPRSRSDAPERTIDLTDQPTRHESPAAARIDPTGRITFRGMRVRRVRLGSVAKIASIFWLLAFAVLLATVVLVWNVAQAFGYIDSFEETMITSLGLESFEVDGSGIFGLVAGLLAVLCILGWWATLAMAAVYNAAAGALGGLALETGPLSRRRRVFSWRHRGFVTVSE